MKKIISLILAVVCITSLCLSGCGKQEIEPITVGELLALLEEEGYTNIQHEEGTCDYILVDSGDCEDEDANDIVISINNIYENNHENDISSLNIEYNSYTSEVEKIVEIAFGELTNDLDLVNKVVTEFLLTPQQLQSQEKGNFFFTYCDNSLKLEDSNNSDIKHYELYISIS